MLRQSFRKMAVPVYALFMIEQKDNPKLANMAVPRRGRATARLYRALSPKDRAALARRAAKRPAFKRTSKEERLRARKPRKASKYGRYVRNHYHDKALSKLTPRQKLKAIAKLWNLQKAGAIPSRPATTTPARKQVKKAAASKAAVSKAATKTRPAPKKNAAEANKNKKKIASVSAAAPSKKKKHVSQPTKRKLSIVTNKKGKKKVSKSSALVKGGMLII